GQGDRQGGQRQGQALLHGVTSLGLPRTPGRAGGRPRGPAPDSLSVGPPPGRRQLFSPPLAAPAANGSSTCPSRGGPLPPPRGHPRTEGPGRPEPRTPCMSIDSVDTLLAVLRRSQLLAPEQVDEVARELGGHFEDPVALGEYLVEIDWLTAYQFQLLLAGRWDELTVGSYQVLDRLGEGRGSEGFKDLDPVPGRDVALNVRRPPPRPQAGPVRQCRRRPHA